MKDKDMKWNFFYDEDEHKKYKTDDEWYQDTKHVIWTVIIAFIAILVSLFILHFNS